MRHMMVHNSARLQLCWTFKVSTVPHDALWRHQRCKWAFSPNIDMSVLTADVFSVVICGRFSLISIIIFQIWHFPKMDMSLLIGDFVSVTIFDHFCITIFVVVQVRLLTRTCSFFPKTLSLIPSVLILFYHQPLCSSSIPFSTWTCQFLLELMPLLLSLINFVLSTVL